MAAHGLQFPEGIDTVSILEPLDLRLGFSREASAQFEGLLLGDLHTLQGLQQLRRLVPVVAALPAEAVDEFLGGGLDNGVALVVCRPRWVRGDHSVETLVVQRALRDHQTRDAVLQFLGEDGDERG